MLDLPKGKLNIVWRQGRCGYVPTVAGKDLLGVAACEFIEDVPNAVKHSYGDQACAKFEELLK